MVSPAQARKLLAAVAGLSDRGAHLEAFYGCLSYAALRPSGGGHAPPVRPVPAGQRQGRSPSRPNSWAATIEAARRTVELARERRQIMAALLADGFSQADLAREPDVTRQAIQKMIAAGAERRGK